MKKNIFLVRVAFIVLLTLLMTGHVYGAWSISSSKDEMTGIVSHFANSPFTAPTEPLPFPYQNTGGWIGVGCNGKQEWAYFGFNNSPNLTNAETKDGYNFIQARIKWDDEIELLFLTQDWGDRFISFTYDESAISKIMKANTALLELNWYGSGKTYFRFPLSGSAAVIKKIRSECAN